MFENLIIANDLYKLRQKIQDKNDISLINSLIEKYKTEINVGFEYSQKEIKSSARVFQYLLSSFYTEPEYLVMPDKEDSSTWFINEEMFENINLLDKELEILINKFSLLRIKNNKTKNQITRNNSILIQNVFLEEANELINKYLKS
jgi:hypothetical protein